MQQVINLKFSMLSKFSLITTLDSVTGIAYEIRL